MKQVIEKIIQILYSKKTLNEKKQISSFLEKIIQDVYAAKQAPEAKKILVDYISKSKIKSTDKNKMLYNLDRLNTLTAIQQYATNALLKYEGLGLSGLKGSKGPKLPKDKDEKYDPDYTDPAGGHGLHSHESVVRKSLKPLIESIIRETPSGLKINEVATKEYEIGDKVFYLRQPAIITNKKKDLYNKIWYNISYENSLGGKNTVKNILSTDGSITLKENKETNIKKLHESGYQENLNSIAEDKANTELKNKLTSTEYNVLFKELQKLDSTASEAAIEVGDSYFPLDTLADFKNYLKHYLKFFNNMSSRKIEQILNKL